MRLKICIVSSIYNNEITNKIRISAIKELNKLGIQIESRIPVLAKINKYNSAYLKSKSERMAHIIDRDTFSGNGRQGEKQGTPPQHGTPRRRATAGIQLPWEEVKEHH